jgi:hypothetical protein
MKNRLTKDDELLMDSYCAYCRVSTRGQDLESQTAAITRFAEYRKPIFGKTCREGKKVKSSPAGKLQNQTVDLTGSENQLTEFCDQIRQDLDHWSLLTKRLALEKLNVQFAANPEHCDVTYKVPLHLLTTGRTSASTPGRRGLGPFSSELQLNPSVFINIGSLQDCLQLRLLLARFQTLEGFYKGLYNFRDPFDHGFTGLSLP